MPFFIRNKDLWSLLPDEEFWYAFPHKLIRNEANENSNGYRKQPENDGYTPGSPIKVIDGESSTTDKYDQELASDNYDLYTQEEIVVEHSLKNIQLVV